MNKHFVLFNGEREGERERERVRKGEEKETKEE